MQLECVTYGLRANLSVQFHLKGIPLKYSEATSQCKLKHNEVMGRVASEARC